MEASLAVTQDPLTGATRFDSSVPDHSVAELQALVEAATRVVLTGPSGFASSQLERALGPFNPDYKPLKFYLRGRYPHR